MPVPSSLQPLLSGALSDVESLFNHHIRSDLPPVVRLCEHVEHYRGKMLRPTLVLVCGLAASVGQASRPPTADPVGQASRLPPSLITAATVTELIHMATLVHDDVLDEADTRRRGHTVNRLHGNEAAVMLGDYLIAAAYHLCSQLHSPETSLLVARTSMTLCEGELLQLSHRENFSLDEPTYFEIIDRKTAALVALACRLGAQCAGGDEATIARLERFGRRTGLAFQIQDDLLDLTGRQSALGKPVGQDLHKGKLTLPVIHHLAAVGAQDRGRALLLLEQACELNRAGDPHRGARPALTPSDAATSLVRALTASGSLDYARARAAALIAEARDDLAPLPPSEAKDLLLSMADDVITRSN